ncbi:hypothetical protein NW754_012091 [Fusarium falciforme]|nr:hypothetical protein NW754_012091 [Fusarium falciforme]
MKLSVLIDEDENVPLCALQGLGVVAHESLAYFKADHSKGGHRYLDGCGKAGKGNWVPDPATFVLPQNNFKPSDHWGLCADGHDCAPHEATGKVYFDFQDDGLVFNLEGIDHYKYEDVSIYVERARPPHAHSTKYNKDSDHCKAKNNYKEVKCHIPYFSLTDGGSYDKMCPLKGEGGWRFYIKIKATIVHGDKRFELYNRESTNGEKYFALSYTCAKCRHHKHDPKIELINAASRRDEGSEHKHHGGHHDGYADSIMATTTATITRSTTIIRSTTATSMDIITRSTMTTRNTTTTSTATITRSTMDISTIMRSITTTRSIMITSMVTATITVTSTRRSTMPSIIMSTTISTTMIMATAILMATSTVTVITTVIITVITMAMSTIIRSTTATITGTTMVIITDITMVMSITISIITATITVTIMVITMATSMVTITVMSIITSITTATTMAMATSMDTTTVTSMDIITVIIMITNMVITTRVTTTATTITEAFTSVMPAFLTTMV